MPSKEKELPFENNLSTLIKDTGIRLDPHRAANGVDNLGRAIWKAKQSKGSPNFDARSFRHILEDRFEDTLSIFASEDNEKAELRNEFPDLINYVDSLSDTEKRGVAGTAAIKQKSQLETRLLELRLKPVSPPENHNKFEKEFEEEIAVITKFVDGLTKRASLPAEPIPPA